MRFSIIIAAVAGLLCFAPAPASAQTLYNPDLPSAPARYPVCAPHIDRNKPRICTANPDLIHNRYECENDRCPEDDPNVYEKGVDAALTRACEGSCLWALVSRPYNDDPHGKSKCVWRVVPDGYQDPDPAVARFDIPLSSFAYTEYNLVGSRSRGSLHRSFQKAWHRQIEDQTVPLFRGRCRWWMV